MVYNVHSLLHLAKQTEIHGDLNRCSAFEFENYMQKLKKLVRQRKNPLVEIVARLGELENLSSKQSSGMSKKHLTSSGEIIELLRVRFLNLQDSSMSKSYLCRKYLKKRDFFCKPCPSSEFGIYVIDTSATSLGYVSAAELKFKYL